MTKIEWQRLNGFTDEEMAMIVEMKVGSDGKGFTITDTPRHPDGTVVPFYMRK